MNKEVVFTEKAPKAIGPYSQAVVADHLVFVSGQLGIDPITGELKVGLQNQAVQAFENLKYILNKAGSSMADVLKTTVYLQDIKDFSTVNEIYGQVFAEPFPARSAFQVVALPRQGLVEIEAIALKQK